MMREILPGLVFLVGLAFTLGAFVGAVRSGWRGLSRRPGRRANDPRPAPAGRRAR